MCPSILHVSRVAFIGMSWLKYAVARFRRNVVITLLLLCNMSVFFYQKLVSIIQNGWTGLMWACRGGYVKTVGVLLEAKADPNIVNWVKSITTTLYTIVT